MNERTTLESMIQMRTWAVVGASNNPEKFGYKVFVSLKEAGYDVYPINPTAPEIAGTNAYPSLEALPVVPDVVDLVVPPSAGVGVVEAAHAKGVKNLWFQPGSESPEAVALAGTKGMAVISGGPCAMVERKIWV